MLQTDRQKDRQIVAIRVYLSLLFVTVCHVIPASGRLVDVDIPKLSESPWPGSDIF